MRALANEFFLNLSLTVCCMVYAFEVNVNEIFLLVVLWKL